MLVGYARVSTVEQGTDLQLDALRKAGVDVIFQEKTSSVGRRPELQKALASLVKGDVLVVYKMDRVARSLRNLLDVIEELKRRQCGFKSLTEPVDTSSPIGEFIVQVLGAVGEFERKLIRERTIAGQLAAFNRGVKLGRRPSSTSDEMCEEMKVLYDKGIFTYPDLGAFYNLHPSTVKRIVTGKSSRPKMPVLGQFVS